MMPNNSNTKVKIQGQLTEEYHIGRGFSQGDALSTNFFYIVLEKVIRHIGINRNGTMFNTVR
jgi:hypothetical protein